MAGDGFVIDTLGGLSQRAITIAVRIRKRARALWDNVATFTAPHKDFLETKAIAKAWLGGGNYHRHQPEQSECCESADHLLQIGASQRCVYFMRSQVFSDNGQTVNMKAQSKPSYKRPLLCSAPRGNRSCRTVSSAGSKRHHLSRRNHSFARAFREEEPVV